MSNQMGEHDRSEQAVPEQAVPGQAGRTRDAERERAWQPEDLGRLVVARLNAGDLDGLVALYEPDAVMLAPDGRQAVGHAAIREAFAGILAESDSFVGEPLPTLRVAGLALTSARLGTGEVTTELARQQPDGSWLWVIDNPDVGGHHRA